MHGLMTRSHYLLATAAAVFFLAARTAAAQQGIIAVSINEGEALRGELVRMGSIPFELHIPPKVLTKGSAVLISETTDAPSPPYGMRIVSPLFHISIAEPNGQHTAPQKPIHLRYTLNVFKEIRRIPYVAEGEVWRPLAVHSFTAEKGVYTYSITQADQAIAFFEPLSQEGMASWYRYRNCDCAASTIYPRGTTVRVWRVSEDGETEPVDVVINDFGPDAKRHPDRVIDLDLSVFKKIAKKGSGIIRVRAELLARREELITAAMQ